MAESLQKWVGRNRPRVCRLPMTWKLVMPSKKELPFVMGVLADLAGHPSEAPPKLKDRRFVEIDRDNFNQIMERLAPDSISLSTID